MFAQIQETLLKIVGTINTYLSDYTLIFLLVAVGLFYSIKTRFVQVRCFGEGMKKVFGNIKFFGGKQKTGMSSFQALTTAVAAQVGTGNIVGACGAIIIGGPGAIFWMWVIAFFGMATIYAEAVIAQKTRKVADDGTVLGGPVYYITTAFKDRFGKFLAGFFAVASILALGFMGAMVQSNSIAEAFNSSMGIPQWAVGITLVVLSVVIFVGGVQRLASVTEKIVPFMACIYIVGGIILLIARIKYIPATFGLIFKYAFMPQAIVGGTFGAALKKAISQGVKRGLFSNEAGMGSTPHAHALANVEKPHDQGVSAMIGVFIDTFVVLTMTALVVISTLYVKGGALSTLEQVTANAATETIKKTNMAQIAFNTVFPSDIAGIFLSVCLFFFAFSTILGWNLFGRINFRYLFGKKAEVIYSVISVVFIFLGTMVKNDLVWDLTDMFNNLMVIPNVIALFFLSKTVVDALKEAKKFK